MPRHIRNAQAREHYDENVAGRVVSPTELGAFFERTSLQPISHSIKLFAASTKADSTRRAARCHEKRL